MVDSKLVIYTKLPIDFVLSVPSSRESNSFDSIDSSFFNVLVWVLLCQKNNTYDSIEHSSGRERVVVRACTEEEQANRYFPITNEQTTTNERTDVFYCTIVMNLM